MNGDDVLKRVEKAGRVPNREVGIQREHTNILAELADEVAALPGTQVTITASAEFMQKITERLDRLEKHAQCGRCGEPLADHPLAACDGDSRHD